MEALDPSRQRQELHPVRLLAGGIGFQLGERAAALVDRIDRHAVGELADRGEVTPRRIDVEAARLLLRRHAADRGQLAACCVDLVAGERVGGALGGVEEAAVRGDVDVGGPGLAEVKPSGSAVVRWISSHAPLLAS